MKRLYISDLDGTLLNSKVEISNYSKDVINEAYSRGVCFTIATARTPYTVKPLTKGMHFTVAAVLMNGVLQYDIENDVIIDYARIDDKTYEKVVDILYKNHMTGFVYAIRDRHLVAYYDEIHNMHMNSFYTERRDKYNKPFVKADSLYDIEDEKVYFAIMDSKDNIDRVKEAISNINELSYEYYQDIYSEGMWYLEVFRAGIDKGVAVENIKNEYGFEEVYCFGDNHNDIPLMKVSDRGYAMGNAKQAVKDAATEVIGSNDGNGVAEKLRVLENLY